MRIFVTKDGSERYECTIKSMHRTRIGIHSHGEWLCSSSLFSSSQTWSDRDLYFLLGWISGINSLVPGSDWGECRHANTDWNGCTFFEGIEMLVFEIEINYEAYVFEDDRPNLMKMV